MYTCLIIFYVWSYIVSYCLIFFHCVIFFINCSVLLIIVIGYIVLYC